MLKFIKKYSVLKNFDLSAAAKDILSIVISFVYEGKKDCFATNKYFAEELGISVPYVKKVIKKLIDQDILGSDYDHHLHKRYLTLTEDFKKHLDKYGS
jgi:Mn-dependent DtxR family transcriptional regulator